jgi:hypothetical protein
MDHRLLDAQGRKLTFRSPSSVAAQVLDVFGLTESIEAETELVQTPSASGVMTGQVR